MLVKGGGSHSQEEFSSGHSISVGDSADILAIVGPRYNGLDGGKLHLGWSDSQESLPP